jgi:hypothetical protein
MKRKYPVKKMLYAVALVSLLLGGAQSHAASAINPASSANRSSMPPAGGPMPVVNCPFGYEKQNSGTAEDMKKGLVKCVKPVANCPQGWEGSTNINTGVLTCLQKVLPSCPNGWQGGVQSGKLICNPNPPAKMICPTSTPDWQWGTSYFSQGWNLVGCTPNVKPAY